MQAEDLTGQDVQSLSVHSVWLVDRMDGGRNLPTVSVTNAFKAKAAGSHVSCFSQHLFWVPSHTSLTRGGGLNTHLLPRLLICHGAGGSYHHTETLRPVLFVSESALMAHFQKQNTTAPEVLPVLLPLPRLAGRFLVTRLPWRLPGPAFLLFFFFFA